MTLEEFNNEQILLEKVEDAMKILGEIVENPMCDDEFKKIIAKFAVETMLYCLKKGSEE